MNQQTQTNQQNDPQGIIGLCIALIAFVVGSKIIPPIRFWIHHHPFLTVLIITFTLYGIFKLAIWRLRKNNPEKYKRKDVLRALKNLIQSPGSIRVGKTIKDGKEVFLSPELRSGHVQILGATGRGKTQSVIAPWFLQDYQNGRRPVLIDGKGDFSLVQQLTSGDLYSAYYFSLDHDDGGFRPINPLEGGSATEIADRLFTALEFESSYFREVQYAIALTILESMSILKKPITLKALYQTLLKPEELLESINSDFPTHLKLELVRLAQMKTEQREEKLSGLLSQLRPFSSGVFEDRVNATGEYMQEFSIENFMNGKRDTHLDHGFVYLLPTMKYQKTAKVLGKLILQQLAWVTSKRTSENEIRPVYIDEFSAFVYEGFEQFLNKARSHHVALHLAHQSMGDLEAVSASFAKTVNVNTNVKVLLGLNDPDTADYFARHLGTFTTTKETERAIRGLFGNADRKGEMSIREVEAYKIHPNRLKSYSRGQGVLSLLVSGTPFVEEVQFDRI